MIRVRTPNGELAEATDWQVSTCGEFFVGSLHSADFEAEMKVSRPFKLQNPRRYDVHYLIWPNAPGIAVNVRDTKKGERVGLICSLDSLSTRNHEWSSDEHFELVASALLPQMLQDPANLSLCVDWHDGRIYELSDFFPERIAIFAIRNSANGDPTPIFYLPSLLRQGFLSYSGDTIYSSFVSSQVTLSREIKVKPISQRFSESAYVRLLFEQILPRESSPLGYFVSSYQVLELLMQEVFQSRLSTFKNFVAAFNGCASDLRQLNQKLAEVTGEEGRLRAVFENCNATRTKFPELTSSCEEVIGKHDKTTLLHDLVYQVRNKILHSLRDLSQENSAHIEAVNRGLNSLIAHLLCCDPN